MAFNFAPYLWGLGLGGLIQAFQSPNALAEVINQTINKLLPMTLMPLEVLVYARSAEFIDRDRYLAEMKRMGFEEADAEMIYNVMRPKATISDLIRAMFRRYGTDHDVESVWQMVDNDLRLYGYDPQERDRIVEASKFMPSLSDLLQWMAKEAFEDDMARELGLDEEFPEKFKEYCRRLGIPEEDALRYWRAHWSSASWTQMAEAFHRERAEAYPRGMHDVVEQEWQRKWDIFYRQVEMPKFYRDLLTKITYSVITRVDARRMYEMGFLTEEELTAIFIANGYRKEDAERMTQWVKTEVQRYAEEDLRGLTRANVDKLYRLGLINDDQYVDLLTKIGVGKDTAEYYLELLKHDIFRELYEARINAIKRKYQKRIITRDEAYKSLVDMGIDAEQAGIYLDAWEEGLVEETRKLSKEDVIKAWKARIFDGSKAYEKLREIGYSHDDAITLLRINGMTIEEVRGLEAELRWG